MSTEEKVKERVRVFIIKTEYGYVASPSPIVVPDGATLYFENLTNVTAIVSIPDKDPFLKLKLEPHGRPRPVNLPAKTNRVIPYAVEMNDKLLARGHSAPIIIRDP